MTPSQRNINANHILECGQAGVLFRIKMQALIKNDILPVTFQPLVEGLINYEGEFAEVACKVLKHKPRNHEKLEIA